jgi:membrane dipeptidase
LLRTGAELTAATSAWQTALDWPAGTAFGDEAESAGPPFGFVLGTEGADCIVTPSQLPLWWEDGLRVVSLVHYGVSRYAHGTGAAGPLTPDGRDLLRAMDEIGAVLDVTHQCDESFWESLERFKGPVLASHQNCRALVPGERQMSDEQLRALIARGAVVGAALDNWMLYPGYVKGETPSSVVGLEQYVDHIDHVCQLAGNARHAAIGSDLDGGYGYEQTPRDLNTIADLRRVPELLQARGYVPSDIDAIMGGNVIRFLEQALP